jgi:hypothetical protein
MPAETTDEPHVWCLGTGVSGHNVWIAVFVCCAAQCKASWMQKTSAALPYGYCATSCGRCPQVDRQTDQVERVHPVSKPEPSDSSPRPGSRVRSQP